MPGEHICAWTHNLVVFTPLPHIIALFSICVSVNFYPLRELDTIGTGRMDFIITCIQRFTPNLNRCNSLQINPSPSILPNGRLLGGKEI